MTILEELPKEGLERREVDLEIFDDLVGVSQQMGFVCVLDLRAQPGSTDH